MLSTCNCFATLKFNCGCLVCIIGGAWLIKAENLTHLFPKEIYIGENSMAAIFVG